MASAPWLSLFKSTVGFIQPYVVGPSGASLQTWYVLICGRWPASRRPCAKLTNTTILSYRWFCITGLWNHDPGIPPSFVLWFWFTGFSLFYRGQKQTELMTGLMTGTQTKTIISNSRFIWMIFTHQHTWQNCLIKKVQSQNEHKSCSAIVKCNHPNFSFS